MELQNLTSYERGFLEAAVDAEGSIQLNKYKTKWTISGFSWSARVVVTNTCVEWLKKVQYICSEPISEPYPYSKKYRTKPCYIYSMKKATMRSVLPQLHLIVKERQRVLILRALELLVAGGHSRWSSREERKELDDELELIYQEMKRLNAKGKVIGVST